MASSSSSSNGSSLGAFLTEIRAPDQMADESENSTFTLKSRVTISMPSDAAQMRRSASDPEIHAAAEEMRAFLRVDGADGTYYQQHSIAAEEAENASLGPFETPNDELATEFDKRSTAAATRTLGRLDLSTPQRINWEAAKSEEISRLKTDIKQLKAEQLKNFGSLSEANDSIARLQDENFALRSELMDERQFVEKLESSMDDACQKLALAGVKVSHSEQEMDRLKKENRRLGREADFLKSDLGVAEKDLKAGKEQCGKLQRDLREVGSKLAHETNRLFIMADDNTLLNREIDELKKSLSQAHDATTGLRHENTQLQDKIQEQQVCLQKKHLETQSLQGHFTKQINSLSRQLAAARLEANTLKLRLVEMDVSPEGQDAMRELQATRRKYDELKKVFQMQQACGGRERVRCRTRRSSISVSEEEVHGFVVGDARPKVTAYVRQLEDENRLLKLRISVAAKTAAGEDGIF